MGLMTRNPKTSLQRIEPQKLLPPIGYFDMLALLKSCSLVLSDSGGLQEEVTAPSIGKFIIVLRTSTERSEAVDAGYARVMGFDKEAIWAEMEARAGKGRPSQEHPYGTGDAARRIANALEGFLGRQPPFP
jgi:UDP-N-acetylglucosamine 2-epimerase (non-hydrolysing)